jgi:hypothetical protein
VLAFYLAKLLRRRVILAPASISWSDHGQTVSKRYEEVRDFQVLSRSEIRVVFSDGQKLAVTSHMADLKRQLRSAGLREAFGTASSAIGIFAVFDAGDLDGRFVLLIEEDAEVAAAEAEADAGRLELFDIAAAAGQVAVDAVENRRPDE